MVEKKTSLLLLATVILLLGAQNARSQSAAVTTQRLFDLAGFPGPRFMASPDGWLFVAFYHSGSGPDSSRYYFFRARGSLAHADSLKWYSIGGTSDFTMVRIDRITGILYNEPDQRTVLVRSTNDGSTWDTVLRSKLQWGYYDVDDSGTVFATLRDRIDGIVFSTDHGNTWRTLINMPTSIRGKNGMLTVRGAENILRTADGTIAYIKTGSGRAGARFTQYGVYYTTDEGKTWGTSSFWRKAVRSRGEDKELAILRRAPNGDLYAGINVLADRTHKHELSQNSHPWYIAHGFELARSTDEGRSWQYVSRLVAKDGETGEWGRALVDLLFAKDGAVIARTPDGVFRSRNGQPFEQVPVPDYSSESGLVQEPDGTMYIVTQNAITPIGQ